MEVKKSPKADLENKKTTNLLAGAIMILAVLFVGFEWSERDKKVTTDTGIQEVVFEEEIIPITEQEQPKQAPPPPEAPKAEEILNIIENDSEVEESTVQASDDTQAAVEVKYTPVEVEEEEVVEEEEIGVWIMLTIEEIIVVAITNIIQDGAIGCIQNKTMREMAETMNQADNLIWLVAIMGI